MTDVHPFCIRFKGETIHYKCSSIFESVSKGNINHPLKWKIIHYISSLEGKKINHPLKPACREKNHPLQKFIHFVRVEWKKNHPSILGV
jgi:hypothetical protein